MSKQDYQKNPNRGEPPNNSYSTDYHHEKGLLSLT